MVWKILKVLFVLGAINGEANRSPIIRNLRAITNLIKVVQGLPNVQKGVLGLQDHLKQAARIGVMLGAAKVEKAMELNLIKLIDDFQRSLHRSNLTGARKKYKEIEAAMNRDKHAIEILLHAMALATTTENVREYREAVNKVAAKDSIERNQKVETKPPNQFDDVKASVDNHLKVMHCKVDAAMKQTIMSMYIKTKKKTSSSSSVSTSPTVTLSDNHMNDIYNRDTVRLPPLYVQMPVWLPGYNIYSYRRQNDDKDDERDDNDNDIDKPKENSEEIREEEFDDDLGSSGNGGIGGLIASLSGGDGGSDVGALVGAISGVITNLFGPGGLDIPLLISTGSSLIAGLLAGDENFGKVLGNYIGLAVEGFSGGGGAVSNGEFFGDFIGSLFSSLSAVNSSTFIILMI